MKKPAYSRASTTISRPLDMPRPWSTRASLEPSTERARASRAARRERGAPVVSLRFRRAELARLDDLALLWGLSRPRTVRRLIERAFLMGLADGLSLDGQPILHKSTYTRKLKRLRKAAQDAVNRLEWLSGVNDTERPWINALESALKNAPLPRVRK